MEKPKAASRRRVPSKAASGRKIGEMASLVPAAGRWKDLRIAPPALENLRMFEARCRKRQGRGLRALFSGPPATEKTMAAAVLAAALKIDLYRIDLSAVVSKSIGETEKNLADATVRPGFDFLGYRFFGNRRYPRPSSEKKLRSRVREKTPRTSGEGMPQIVKRVNASLRGWFEYFKHSSRYAFDAVDKYVRMRLRSVLRKRAKRKGRERGSDHVLWPNVYFQQLRLFSLCAHHQLLRQSVKPAH